LWPEIRSALPDWTRRVRFYAGQALRALCAPMIPPLMAQRIRDAQHVDFSRDCACVQAPTLIVSGEEPLDSVVPVHVTRKYASLIPGARYEILAGTGHIGALTQPCRFAQIVSGFVHAHSH
jgi:3-oxoadipate enol-lactonase